MPIPWKCKVLLYQLHLTYIINTMLYELHGSGLFSCAMKRTIQIVDFEMGSHLPDFEAGAAVTALLKGSELQSCGNCQ